MGDQASTVFLVAHSDAGDRTRGEFRSDRGDGGEVDGLRTGECRGYTLETPLVGQRDHGRLGQVGVGGPGDRTVLRRDELARFESPAHELKSRSHVETIA